MHLNKLERMYELLKLSRVMLMSMLACMVSVSAFASFERGDQGQEVLDIQKRLVELNYPVSSLDGDFGGETENAIKKFQADKGLAVDGVIGQATYMALMNKDLPVNRAHDNARAVIRAGYGVIGTPYVFGGTGRGGFDCSGFTQYCFRRAGINIPRMADEQYYSGVKISTNQLRPGDLVFFTTYAPGASHCGIYIGNGQFLHAGCSTGVTVSNLWDSYWGPRYYGACRIR